MKMVFMFIRNWVMQNAKTITISIVCFILGAALCWILFGEGLRGNGDRIDAAYGESDKVGEYQQSAYEFIESVGDGLRGRIESVDSIEERNEKIERTVDNVADGNRTSIEITRESADRIKESQTIIDRIRERGAKN